MNLIEAAAMAVRQAEERNGKREREALEKRVREVLFVEPVVFMGSVYGSKTQWIAEVDGLYFAMLETGFEIETFPSQPECNLHLVTKPPLQFTDLTMAREHFQMWRDFSSLMRVQFTDLTMVREHCPVIRELADLGRVLANKAIMGRLGYDLTPKPMARKARA